MVKYTSCTLPTLNFRIIIGVRFTFNVRVKDMVRSKERVRVRFKERVRVSFKERVRVRNKDRIKV